MNEMSSRQPTARTWHSAVGVGDKLFIWGGHGAIQIRTTTLECFNVSSLSWEQPQQLKGSLPDGLYNLAVTGDGRHFYAKSGRTNRVYEINPCTLLCRQLLKNSSIHAPQRQDGNRSRSVYFKNKVVVYGGVTEQDRTDDLHVFDLDKSEYESIELYSCIGSGASYY